MNDTHFKNALLALGFAADASGTVLSKRLPDAAGDGAWAVRPLTASPRRVALPQDAKRGNANALDSQTPFVALYASSWNGAEVVADYRLISLQDNADFLKTLPKDAPSFAKAATVKDRFRAWKETYQQEFTTRGLFHENAFDNAGPPTNEEFRADFVKRQKELLAIRFSIYNEKDKP